MKFLVVFLCVVAAAVARDPPVFDCLARPETGPCRAHMPSYYYNPHTGTCERFIYGGCKGNGNRFQTEEQCLRTCEGVRATELSSDVCSLEKDSGPCYAHWPRFHFDQQAGVCKEFIYGGCAGNGNNFKTIEECQATCRPAQRALDRPDCDKGPEAGNCMAYIPRFYYDQPAGMCKSFIYGGCGGNRNNFKTEFECYNKCGALLSARRVGSPCVQEKIVGPCRGAFPRYFFNKQTGQCEFFIYGGCSGNDNNFVSQEDCEAICA